jgi:Zn-dependent peptidase ImmA (M78 family)/transcriptional regulator with XRE-family HTH domain
VKKRPEPGAPPLGHSDLHLAAHLFDPARLTIARELRESTKADLASRIGKTAAAVGQFENGRARPDAGTLASLALALGLPISFFARRQHSPLMTLDLCHFRSLRSASQRGRRSLLARGTLLCDVLSFLDERVELPEEIVSTVAESPTTMEDIENCAVRVRRGWGLGLGPIPHLVRLLESKGVVVTLIPHNCEDMDAFSAWHAKRPIIFLVDHKGSTSRLRFDAAHELGHLVMHADVVAGSPELERQANRFASAFLLPRETFLPECPRRLNWPHFYELKRRWKVSVAALVRRAYDLECISEASYRRAYMHLNQTGERTSERDEPVPEYPTLVAQAMHELADELAPEELAETIGLPISELKTIVGLDLSDKNLLAEQCRTS